MPIRHCRHRCPGRLAPVTKPRTAFVSSLEAMTPSFCLPLLAWPRRSFIGTVIAGVDAISILGRDNARHTGTRPGREEPGDTGPEPVDPRIAVPVPFWVTSSALPVLLVVKLVLAVPALFAAPRMKLPPAAPATTPDTNRASPIATNVANGLRARKLDMATSPLPTQCQATAERRHLLPSPHHTSAVWCSEGWFRFKDRVRPTCIRALD